MLGFGALKTLKRILPCPFPTNRERVRPTGSVNERDEGIPLEVVPMGPHMKSPVTALVSGEMGLQVVSY